MPRYFFHFRQGSEHRPDADGVEFPDVERAYLEAYAAAQDMWSELLKQRRDPRRCFFEVRNEAGALLFSLPFQEVMDSCTDRDRRPLCHNFEHIFATARFAQGAARSFKDEMQTTLRILQQSRALLDKKL